MSITDWGLLSRLSGSGGDLRLGGGEAAGGTRLNAVPISVAVDRATLGKIPTVIAVAAGRDKVAPIIARARAHYFNQLVTDPRIAEEIMARA